MKKENYHSSFTLIIPFAVTIVLILLLSNCTTKIEKKLNLIGRELEKIRHVNVIQFEEIQKIRKLIKKEIEKCDEYFILPTRVPGQFAIVPYCPDENKLKGEVTPNEFKKNRISL